MSVLQEDALFHSTIITFNIFGLLIVVLETNVIKHQHHFTH
jgi:hypothetical protein